jgi:hypothetical protein
MDNPRVMLDTMLRGCDEMTTAEVDQDPRSNALAPIIAFMRDGNYELVKVWEISLFHLGIV